MNLNPAKLKMSIMRLSAVWQASLALLLFLVWAVALVLQVPEHLEHLRTATMFGSAALCAANLSLYAWVSYARRRQLRLEESLFILSNFRDPAKFAEIFSGAFDFEPGIVNVNGRVPEFSFLRTPDSEDEILELTDINLAAFQGTAWSGEKEKKFSRNLEFWRKNPNTFMVLDRFDEHPIGDLFLSLDKKVIFFSCILPLSENGFQRYFIDKVSGDNEFRADWIAPVSEKPHALLLFTFARHPDLVKTLDENWRAKLIFLYLRCVAVHLQKFLETQYADEREATVYFQNSGVPFKRLASCAKMDESKLKSRDDETVYVTTFRAAGPTFSKTLSQSH